jgi:hypothetical protein
MSLYGVRTFEPSHTAEVGAIDDGYFYASTSGATLRPNPMAVSTIPSAVFMS